MDPTANVDVADPRGWLKAVPQLYRFCQDPKIREAVELGDGAKLWKALKAAKKNPAFANDQAAINEMLGVRRLFLHGSGAPSLFTLNGFGTKIYGKSDESSDGTYITTLFLTALFIPVIPIKQYLVRHEGGNRYAFYGTVPSSDAIKAWQWVTLGGPAAMFVLLLVMGMIGAAVGPKGGGSTYDSGGGSFGDYFSGQTVYLTNGLDVPLKVQWKDPKDAKNVKSWKVASQGHERATLPSGEVELDILSTDDVLLEHDKVTIPSESFVAYNIFASAPVYAQGAIYTKDSVPLGTGEKEEYHYFTGQKVITYPGIQYYFEDPPKEVSMSKYESRRTLWYTGVEAGGWLTNIVLMEKEKKSDAAAKLAEMVLLAEPEDSVAQKFARYYVTKYKGTEGAVELGSKMIDMWPNSLEAHRFYQDYAMLSGKHDELVAKYKEMYAQDKSAWMGYLYARVAPVSVSRPLYEELVQKYPKESYVHRGYGWLLLNSQQYEDALAEFQQTQRLDPDHHGDLITYHARALVALGRYDEAAKLIEELEDARKLPALANAVLYGQIANAAPGKTAHDADWYLNRRADENSKSADTVADDVMYDLIVAGKPARDTDLDAIVSGAARDAAEIMSRGLESPNAAVKLAKEVPDDSFERMDPSAVTLIALELARTGDSKNAERCFNAIPELARHKAEMIAFVKSGKVTPELNDIDLEMQAAMKLVRARAMPKSDKKRVALIKEAKEADVMHGFVTHAAVAWAN